MRFTHSDDARPRRHARHLKAELAARGIPRELGDCLDTVARACGHDGWSSMRRSIGREPASVLDDESDEATVAARRGAHEGAMRELGLGDADAADVAEALRLTARRHGRTALSAARVTFLDVPWTQLLPLPDEHVRVMAETLERERVMNVHRKGAGLTRESLDTFLKTVPPNVRAVTSRFVDSPYEATFGLLAFLGTLSRTEEEASLWCATVQEISRRLDGRTVRMGHFAEAFSAGVPTDAVVADIMARRASGERTVGVPRFPDVIPPNSVGLMVNGLGRKPYVVHVPGNALHSFIARHVAMFDGAPADPTEDYEAYLGLRAELLMENAKMLDTNPELHRSAGILLFLTFVHPERGQVVRDAVAEALGKGSAYVTLSVSDTFKVRTSVSDAFEDRARIRF